MIEYQGFQLAPADFLRRHFLVYDAAFTKVGSLDLRRGVWYFTLSSTGETWFGLTRDDCIRSWLRSYDETSPPPCSAPRAFPALKTTL